MKVLSQKKAGDRTTLTFDFTAMLNSGEHISAIASGSPSIIVNSGADATPINVFNGAAAVAQGNRAVLVPVKDGLPNCSYRISVTVETNATPARRLTLDAILPIAYALSTS